MATQTTQSLTTAAMAPVASSPKSAPGCAGGASATAARVRLPRASTRTATTSRLLAAVPRRPNPSSTTTCTSPRRTAGLTPKPTTRMPSRSPRVRNRKFWTSLLLFWTGLVSGIWAMLLREFSFFVSSVRCSSLRYSLLDATGLRGSLLSFVSILFCPFYIPSCSISLSRSFPFSLEGTLEAFCVEAQVPSGFPTQRITNS